MWKRLQLGTGVLRLLAWCVWIFRLFNTQQKFHEKFCSTNNNHCEAVFLFKDADLFFLYMNLFSISFPASTKLGSNCFIGVISFIKVKWFLRINMLHQLQCKMSMTYIYIYKKYLLQMVMVALVLLVLLLICWWQIREMTNYSRLLGKLMTGGSESFKSQLAGMAKHRLYDVMSQMNVPSSSFAISL